MAYPILNRAQGQLEQGLPFVIYKKPKEFEIKGVFQRDTQLHSVTDFTESGFVFAPFDTVQSPILIQCDEVLSEVFTPGNISTTKNPLKKEVGASESYERMVSRAIEAIKSGQLEKVVLSRKKEVRVAASALVIFQRLVHAYENALCYLWHHPKIGTWLGATPEILLKSRGNSFVTMSLAGTQMVREEVEMPEWEKKELHEQQLVTDYIATALQDTTTDLKIGDLESVRAGQLWHLRTKISGRFEREKLGTLIRALHPTPAVCGIPTKRAKKFILENEHYDRMFYTGYLGELNLKNEVERSTNPRNTEQKAYRSVLESTELFVNLRCMQLDGTAASIFIGGGITSDSDPWKEWEETENKSQTILKVLLD
ncbi:MULTISPECIES: chorismate-binding protein [Maribacter]|uniref:Chorismate-binding protein n=1 Tax=Maribacter flavus TaxID=1658664 RepID=A0A5B2TT49_9FLAO|nr:MULTISPECIES: chorismate-binding protein [Maribacter]KAA2217363.1 isochorismate synthase [Maribacter flavus]MDC6405754.1 chorismate-binding protein [Maribacter sp. PR66]MEE1972994.1 chorismate-binding protein [Maribacter flavus]